MKKKIILLSGVLGLSLATSFGAFSAEKIAYVDSKSVFDQLPQLKSISVKLDKELGPQAEKLRKEEIQLVSDIKAFESSAAKMKKADKNKAEEKLVQRKREFQGQADKFLAFKNERQRAEGSKLMEQVKNAIKDVAKESGYDMVLEQQQVAFGEAADDITAKVTKKLQK